MMGESEGPITRDEMIRLFGDHAPMEAVSLIWDSPDTRTVGQIRVELRVLAARKAGILRVGRAIVAAEQDQWVTPAADWTFDTLRSQGLWDVAEAAYDAALAEPPASR